MAGLMNCDYDDYERYENVHIMSTAQSERAEQL